MEAGGLNHVVVAQSGGRRLVKRAGFVRESDLQILILNAPELLGPLGTDLRLIPIGWEVSLGPGRLDLLFLDSEGILTLVETKLKANDESRREVVGQILEYAAFTAAWSTDSVKKIAEEFLASNRAPVDIAGRTMEEAAAIRFDWPTDDEAELLAKADALMAKLDSALKDGRLRIVCGVDERIENLERLVRYLSAHSDLQVVLLQVNRFPVDGELSVLVPTLHGDIDGVSPRRGASAKTLSVAEIVAAFPEGTERSAVSALLDVARTAGAIFAPGPSGLSIRAKCALRKEPVTVAWVFAPGKPPWMKTRDISFGHGLDYPNTEPSLRAVLEAYFSEFAADAFSSDASSKGVRARWYTPDQVAGNLPLFSQRLAGVIKGVAELSPAASTA